MTVLEFLRRHGDPVPAARVMEALGMSHAKAYAELVRLEAKDLVRVVHTMDSTHARPRMGWEAM